MDFCYQKIIRKYVFSYKIFYKNIFFLIVHLVGSCSHKNYKNIRIFLIIFLVGFAPKNIIRKYFLMMIFLVGFCSAKNYKKIIVFL